MNEYFEKQLMRLANPDEMFSSENIDSYQYPEFLYKYKEISKYSLDMLERQYLWADLPMQSLDTSDSLIRLELYEKDEPALITVLKRMFEQKNSITQQTQPIPIITKHELTLSEKKKLQQLILTQHDECGNIISWEKIIEKLEYFFDLNPYYQLIEKYLVEQTEFLRNRANVGCLSKRKNNRMMWERYAGGFSGFVIEYDLHHDNTRNIIGNIFPMNYYNDEDLPCFNYAEMLEHATAEGDKLKQFNKDVLYCLLVKHSDYAFEEEWRILVKENEIPLKINAIYIGYKCSMEDESMLSKACKKIQIPAYKQCFNKLNGKMYFELIT